MPDTLDKLRNEIDQCDAEILRQLNRRCEISQRIGKYKKSCGISVRDAGRENALMLRLQTLNQSSGGLLPETALREIYQIILRTSRDLQS